MNETWGSVSGLVAHVLGDLDFAEARGAEFICPRHWARLCLFVLRKPCLSIQWRDHAICLGTPGSHKSVAGSCVTQGQDRAQGQDRGGC